MRKLFSFALLLLLSFSLSACGNEKQQTEHTSASQISDSASAQTNESDTNAGEIGSTNADDNLEKEEQEGEALAV